MNRDEFNQLKASLNRPLVMAHRGASTTLPENSLSAFKQAVDDGADIIETDLHFTQDDEIVKPPAWFVTLRWNSLKALKLNNRQTGKMWLNTSLPCAN